MPDYIDTGVQPEYIEVNTGKPVVFSRPYVLPVYGCRIYDGEELIHEYKPCRNPEGVEGMYDFIAEEFIDRDSFVQMWLEHFLRSDEISIRFGGSEWD